MFSVVVDVDGLNRKFDVLAARSSDLDKPLGQFGKWLRGRAKARYLAQDFAPLATSTLERRAQSGSRALERKLYRDVRLAVGRASGGSVMESLLGGVDFSAYATRGVRNRFAVLAEFQREHRRGTALAARDDLKPLTFKQQVSLAEREQRAVEKAVDRPILGRLVTSLKVEVGHEQVTLASRAKGLPTEVHNEGGTAGGGARVPERRTILLEEADLGVFEQILVEHHLAAFQGPA